jgi:3-phenylpropionate/trans-cinnamate dioxygenase ferredoxin subunit
MDRIRLGSVSEFPQGHKVVNAGGKSVLVVNTGLEVYAVLNQCSHLPLPLAGGKIEGETITCPFHMSKFNLRTGENLDWTVGFAGLKTPAWSHRLISFGKKPTPLQAFNVVQDEGTLYLELQSVQAAN